MKETGTQTGCCVDKSCNRATCMLLPRGRTCADCAHVDRCVTIFGANSANTYCDFFPRKFRAANITNAAAHG